MQRRKYSREFKLEAVKLIRERGVSVAQASRDLDVHQTVLRKWIHDFGSDPVAAFPGHGKMKPEQLEITRLRREVAKLKAERDILKKAVVGSTGQRNGLSKHISWRREAKGFPGAGIEAERDLIEIVLTVDGPIRALGKVLAQQTIGVLVAAALLGALGVSRSGFHAWLTRAPSPRARSDEEIGARVRTSHVTSYRTYGARRVWRDILAEGYRCGLHKIERLMRVQGLRARPRRRGLPKDHGERSVIAGNVLDRQFTAGGPNQKWVADFTYIWTAEGWLYVAAVIDLFSRHVVGWSMGATMTAQLVTDALIMAIWRRGKPDALLHHSDQGSQYISEQFQRLMAGNGVTCSMSRSGNCWDNAAMESFFSSLKTERIVRKAYRRRDEAKADVFDYIECFYNPTRRHSTIGYKSPIDFESEAGVA